MYFPEHDNFLLLFLGAVAYGGNVLTMGILDNQVFTPVMHLFQAISAGILCLLLIMRLYKIIYNHFFKK